jgi:molybdopterin-guanine dinucleotide biosynthesis protein A
VSKKPLGAAVLCGGRSSRMGRPKALLPFGGETLLERVVGRLRQVADPVIVVAAPDQPLPSLAVEVVRDPVEGRGPLQGIAVALRALEPHAERAFISATDAPFLSPAFVRRMQALAADCDVAILRDGGHHHPLAAVYATWLAAEAEALLAAGRARPFFLLERGETRIVERDELLADPALRAADPELWSLRNLNHPEDYQAALRDR